MALSDKRIIELMKTGHIIIDPFDIRQLATSSYDVRLGEWHYRGSKRESGIYNIWSERQMREAWGQPLCAEIASKVLPDDFEFCDGVNHDDQVIVIEPGETILCHTEEFIGGRDTVTTMMKARSSLGRSHIEVCKCAGWGDVGFFNRWTMEVTNNSRDHIIPLVVGRRIAQIIFFETGPIRLNDYSSDGKYQTGDDVEELKVKWEPNMMLPRLYKDREARSQKK